MSLSASGRELEPTIRTATSNYAHYHGGWWGAGGYRRYGDVDINRTITTPRGTYSNSIKIDRDWDGDIDIDRDTTFEPNENIYNKRDNLQRNVESRRDDAQRTVAVEDGREIGELAIDEATDRVGREPLADVARDIEGAEWLIELANRSVWECDLGHGVPRGLEVLNDWRHW